MPQYQVTSPDGQAFTITAPDGATQEQVLAYAKQNMPGKAEPNYQGSILPFSSDAQGRTHFDSNAGIFGTMKRAFMAPGDALAGNFDAYSPEGQARAREMATVISPANPAIRAGDRVIPGVLKSLTTKKADVPTAAELKEAASQGYKAARATDAQYPAQDVSKLAAGLRQHLEENGFVAENHPETFNILKRLESPPDGDSYATISQIDGARRAFSKVAGNFNKPSEQEASNRAIRAIDEFISGYRPSGAVDQASPSARQSLTIYEGGRPAEPAGETPEAQAARLITEARGNTAAAKRSERITDAGERADLNAAVANSGLNVENQIRQRLRDILLDPKKSRGYSDSELALMEQIARGTPTRNTLRFMGHVLGGGGGLGSLVATGLGGAVGSVEGAAGAALGAAAAPAAGLTMRNLSNSLTAKDLAALDAILRMRSPLYNNRTATAGMTPRFSPTIPRAAQVFGAPAPQQQQQQQPIPFSLAPPIY